MTQHNQKRMGEWGAKLKRILAAIGFIITLVGLLMLIEEGLPDAANLSRQVIEWIKRLPLNLAFYIILIGVVLRASAGLYSNANLMRSTVGYAFVIFGLLTILFGIPMLIEEGLPDAAEPPRQIYVWIKGLPLNLVFYIVLVGFLSTYVGLRLCSYATLIGNCKAKQKILVNHLSPTSHTWDVVRNLRRRGFILRTRAGMTLGVIFVSLFTGIYFMLFIVPEIEKVDKGLPDISKFEYGLKHLREGLFWLKHPDLSLKAGERITVVTFSENGEEGVLTGDKGSVFTTSNYGEEWKSTTSTLGLKEEEFIIGAAFSKDGKNGVLIGTKGLVLTTSNYGKEWKKSAPLDRDTEENEFIIGAAFSKDGKIGVSPGDEGSVFITSNYGEGWENIASTLRLEEEEFIIGAAFSKDGKNGVLIGTKGSVFITSNYGGEWKNITSTLRLKEEEFIIGAAFSKDGKNGVLVGIKGSVFTTSNHGEAWWNITSTLDLEKKEFIFEGAFFGKDGKNGVLVGIKGSVFTTSNYGVEWRKITSTLVLKKEELIIGAAFSENGKNGVLAGDKGSVFIAQDGGEKWIVTEKDQLGDLYDQIFAAPRDQYPYASADGKLYILRKYPDLDSSNKEALKKALEEDKFLKGSNFAKEFIGGFFLENWEEPRNSTGTPAMGTSPETKFLGPYSQGRIFAGIFLFFLLHLLVRIYQYNLRLANFWDSRADAILLAEQYTKDPTETFDVLVDALAPDEYDFKSSPKWRFGTLLRRNTPPS